MESWGHLVRSCIIRIAGLLLWLISGGSKGGMKVGRLKAP